MRRYASLIVVLVVAAMSVLFGRPAWAHGMAAAYLEITETGADRAMLRVTSSVPASGLRVPTPEGCHAVGDDAGGTSSPRDLVCEGGLEGHVLRVEGIGPLVSEVVVQITFADGAVSSRVLTASAPAFPLPRSSRRLLLLVDYARLGLTHIFGGADHLLFLVALAISVRKLRAILLAETAFTVAHTLSFTASALGFIRVPSSAAEACIAWTLILIALDAAGTSQGARPPRGPAGVAFAFGLVHGLGFAGGLREIGLPDRAVGWALAGFAVGVELGQLVFLALLVSALALLARAAGGARRLANVSLVLAYVVGTTGAYLLVDRGQLFFFRPA